MTRVIVAATPLAGHTAPALSAARALVAAGHDVEFIGGSRFLPTARGLGATASPLRGRANYTEEQLAALYPDPSVFTGPFDRVVWEAQHVFGDAIPDQHAQLQDRLHDHPDTVLLSDNLFLGGWPSSVGAGLRPRSWITLGITPLQVASRDTTPMGPVPVAPGEDEHAAVLAAQRSGEALFQPARDHVDRIVRDLGGYLPDLGWIGLTYVLPDVTAQLTIPNFEFTRTDLPASIEFIGTLPPLPDPAWEKPAWWAELDHHVPVVVVTQGTLANDDFSELVEPALAALADQDVLVVVALGRETDALQVQVPDNARVAAWLPFDQLLPRADLLLSNGGYGGVQQALAAGVPVIVTGVSEDKPFVGAHVQSSGVGLALGLTAPDVDRIRTAVGQVLADDGFRVRAGALAQQYRHYDASASLDGLVQRIPQR